MENIDHDFAHKKKSMERLQLFFAYAAKLSSPAAGLCKNIQQSISKMMAQK